MIWFFLVHFDFGVLNVIQRQLGPRGSTTSGRTPMRC